MTKINKKEKLLVEYVLGNREAFIKATTVMKPDFFEAPLNSVVKFVQLYFNTYHSIPDMDIIEAETNVELKERDVDQSEVEYVLDEIQDFCSRAAMTDAILQSVDLVNAGDITKVQALVRDALTLNIDKTLGTDLFDDPEERRRRAEESRVPYTIGIPAFDELNGSRWYRGELYLLAAGTSVGKSVMLGNFGALLSSQKLDTLIVSVEMDEDPYSSRLDSMITGLPINGASPEDVANSLNAKRDKYGSIITKRVNGKFGVEDLRAYLMEYHLQKGKYPDVLILDYIDIFANGSNTGGLSKFDFDEYKTHAIRDLLVEFDMMGFSACQLNRDSYGSIMDVSPAHIAGGLSKVNGSDATFIMIATEDDIENNQLQVKAVKVRNATKTPQLVTLYRCPKTLRVTDTPSATPKAAKSPVGSIGKNKTTSTGDTPKGKTNQKDKLQKALKLTK